jgi:hypothetical protein
MLFNRRSTFSFNGDLSATPNTLTHVQGVNATLNLNSLSSVNYTGIQPNASNPNNLPVKPNANNQLVFMNQPMSWWLDNINSEAIHYLPYSNHVNWGYKTESGAVLHIDMTISDLIIPNRYMNSSMDTTTKKQTTVFEEKFGMGRTDIMS